MSTHSLPTLLARLIDALDRDNLADVKLLSPRVWSAAVSICDGSDRRPLARACQLAEVAAKEAAHLTSPADRWVWRNLIVAATEVLRLELERLDAATSRDRGTSVGSGAARVDVYGKAVA